MMPTLNDDNKERLNLVWHRLKPWPDSVAGLKRLKKKFTIAPLSNGNVALLSDMAKNAGLPWDLILSAELAKHYKPDRESYMNEIDLLGLKKEEVMIVTGHIRDINAAGVHVLPTRF